MENGREGRRGMSATVEREGGGGKREKWVKERKQSNKKVRESKEGSNSSFYSKPGLPVVAQKLLGAVLNKF